MCLVSERDQGVSESGPRRGRNPQTAEELILESRKVVTWKYSPVLKKAVNGRHSKASSSIRAVKGFQCQEQVSWTRLSVLMHSPTQYTL